ncbi:hypothetical protein B0H14DRAFT_3858329 [Mycena olivaceomarginata]|nr:hypothetical protein B0H14DRAFT_3858329 [Mycena olivaceomarginata]
MPTALAPSKIFHEVHLIQLALNASATAPDHMYCPRSRQRTSSGSRPYAEIGLSVWYIEMQMPFLSSSPRGGSLARRSHTCPAPHPFSSAPYQQLKDTYTCIESPHPNTNSELANCRVSPPPHVLTSSRGSSLRMGVQQESCVRPEARWERSTADWVRTASPGHPQLDRHGKLAPVQYMSRWRGLSNFPISVVRALRYAYLRQLASAKEKMYMCGMPGIPLVGSTVS